MASDSSAKPLQNAMKMAQLAIQLDAGNRRQEAYCEYLRTVRFVSHSLLEGALFHKEGKTVAVEEEKMLMLAEQCLERAKSFIGKPGHMTQTAHSTEHAPSSPACLTANSPPSESPADTDSRSVGHGGQLSGGEQGSFPPPQLFQKLQTLESQDQSRKELTPIEEASRLNQKLRASYEARLARLTPGQAYQKTSLTLSLQRQMMENLIIARARQDALQRKMEERRQRLQEEANRRFTASGAMTAEEQEQRLLYANVLEYEQDHDWPKTWKANLKRNPGDMSLVSGLVSYLLSRADHPVVKLLRKHQYRIYNRLYPIVSKTAAPHSPAQPHKASCSSRTLQPEAQRKQTRTAGSAETSLSHDPNPSEEEGEVEGEENQHTPSTVERENSFEDLEQFLSQLDWNPGQGAGSELTFDPSIRPEADEGGLRELEMRALKEHLKVIVKDIHIAIDQLLSLCLLSFECLNSSSLKDVCLASVEEAFFTPLWSPLLALFRKVYREREEAVEVSMKLSQHASPADLGVSPKLCPPEGHTSQSSSPYESAVQELRLLVGFSCPQRKLDCIVRTLRLICACAEEYRGQHEEATPPRTAAIGADDLLPILSFVALRSDCPQLVSECAALEEFIHEGFLIGEEGYCLTSMQSALAHAESMHTTAGGLEADSTL